MISRYKNLKKTYLQWLERLLLQLLVVVLLVVLILAVLQCFVELGGGREEDEGSKADDERKINTAT